MNKLIKVTTKHLVETHTNQDRPKEILTIKKSI